MRPLSFVALSLLIGCATSYTPRTNSRDELVRYVNRAADLVARQGEGACATLAEPQWRSGEWYIFVSNVETDAIVCHPTMVGQSTAVLRDVNGKYMGREMETVATGPQGRGWVDYMWPRPGQTTPERKSAYVVGVTGPDGKRYVVGSGGYGMM